MDQDADLLTGAVTEVARLLDADGAMIYLVDASTGELRFAYDAGVDDAEARRMLRDLRLPIGSGVFGTALAQRELVVTDDYRFDQRFAHHDVADRIVASADMRSMAAAPMFANEEPLGVLGAFSTRPAAFSEQQLSLLRSLAGHAAAAIGNRRLVGELRASDELLRQRSVELERTLAGQRALDEISRRIVDVADSAEVLQQVVDVACGLLGSDGAHLTIMNDEGTDLIPMVMANKTEPGMRSWLRRQRFPVGGGLNGLAAATGSVVWTDDYRSDPRLPHDPDDDSAERMELGAAAVAPLRGPGGDVIGTLAITYRQPRQIDPRDVALLDDLARQASIAARNARLYAEVRERTEALARVVEAQHTLYAELEQSERRYRYLVDHSPDLVWAVDGEGRFTYLGETLERLTGFTADALLGRPWTSLLSSETLAVAEATWAALQERPDEEQQLRVQTMLAGGGAIAAEINMIGTIVDGRFAGAHGSLRDITERERLETDLRRRSAELAANEERANLARDLHDSVTQALFSMGLTLRTAELLFDRDPAAARAKLADLRELQKDALAEMRTLIFELRPRGLETDGLAQALHNHGAGVEGRTGLEVGVEASLQDRLPMDIEEALYRIAQEALHNVVKHANARRAKIRLRRSGREIQLSVEDDGAGFDPAKVSGAKLGLAGMRQRAEQAGGRLTIRRRPSGGTRVAVIIPVEGGKSAAGNARESGQEMVTTI